ncbi:MULTISPECIES: hypothetical protein [Thermomonospora]|uniref:Uncharacterized protein n=1 Tax=Thermomonospora curvata (strain ATCC 19995 / DSM 43183 / JCM 3096 / KCTC 9072 / NBRC 15933 / NCIMB 10081 / Henssen B9) TaxID=471852 RepID=D1ABY7_THECD|nr:MULTISPECIES: hypothetical protein [Thermomonospora]ACY97253.1 hypothetical protein Tcur_1678 [Thermomonospora curvata DSM 43183]PKK14624.1 MAG: hypothetical protein BUE48_008245 [Thermomonospora sp. CIF 1]
MLFMIIAAVALIAFVLSLVYLVEFARVSRYDALFSPADRAAVRRARWVTGMYVRTYAPSAHEPEQRELLHR